MHRLWGRDGKDEGRSRLSSAYSMQIMFTYALTSVFIFDDPLYNIHYDLLPQLRGMRQLRLQERSEVGLEF